ncbi:MAG: hypothetical protein ACRD1T_09155 [Acidimicrobiia bacterium]
MNDHSDSHGPRGTVEDALKRAESALADGRGLTGTGFWKSVSIARSDPEIAKEFAGRIAELDRRVFQSSVRLRVPEPIGLGLLAAGTGLGVAAITLSSRFGGLLGPIVFLGGFGAIDIATHSLAHWAVGRLLGMRFTHFFLGGPPPPRPGAKVDYESYLLSSPNQRAAMHASGALLTKLVPFSLIPFALAMQMPRWVSAVLLIAGAGQLITDIEFSTKTSDWKKVRRELRAARRYTAQS